MYLILTGYHICFQIFKCYSTYAVFFHENLFNLVQIGQNIYWLIIIDNFLIFYSSQLYRRRHNKQSVTLKRLKIWLNKNERKTFNVSSKTVNVNCYLFKFCVKFLLLKNFINSLFGDRKYVLFNVFDSSPA